MILRLVATLALPVALVACASDPDTREDRELRVVTTVYPLAEAAERVGGNQWGVTNLTPPGVEPHDLELAPEDLEAIAAADVIVMVGGGFQPAVEDAIESEANGAVIDALDHIDRLGDDPHFWLDPIRYAEVVDVIGETLGEEGSEPRARAAEFVDDLEGLDTSFETGLTGCDSTLLITSHESFGYLADRYGLTQEGITGITPDSEPDPERLAELEALVREEGVTTVFTEEPASPELAQTLADEAGVDTAVLNPLEGLTDEQLDAGEDYLSVMNDNLDSLRGGLGCT